MFGKPKPVVFDPYGSRRSRPFMPRWLALLLLGIAIGAGGVLFVQQRYLPPRLSAAESSRLRAAFEQADRERTQLKADLAQATKALSAARADNKTLADDLAASRQTAERLRRDAAALVELMPPDPRGGTVAVRAARFDAQDGQFAYDLVLSRDGAPDKPLKGVVQFVLSGASGRDTDSVTLPPLPVSIGHYEALHGSLPLPAGFTPRQATVNVLDGPDGKRLGMRVLYVK